MENWTRVLGLETEILKKVKRKTTVD